MKLWFLGGAARHGWGRAALLTVVLGHCPSALAQDEADSPDDGAELADDTADAGLDDAGDTAAASDDVEAPALTGHPEWHSPLRVLVGSRLVNRTFRYTDPQWERDGPALKGADYPRFTRPMPRAEVRWYPAAHVTDGWLSQLGLVGGYEIEVGARLSHEGVPVGETHDFWFIGARGRVPLGDIALGFQLDYGSHRFELSGDEDKNGLPIFPDVVYSQLEIGADFEWRIEQLIVGLHGSYNILLGLGPIGEDIDPGPDPTPWFPGSGGTAVDFGAYVGWQLSPVFDVLVGLDMRAYGLDFGTVPDTVNPAERVIAGGAIDRYMSAWLALAIKLPAKGAAAAGAGAAAASASADDEDDDLDGLEFD